MSRSLFFGLAVAVILLLVAGTLASAQAIKIAVVDIDLVSAQYNELNQKQSELATWFQGKHDFLTALGEFMFISADEFQEVARILQVPKDQWTDAQKKREAELRKITTDNERKFVDLQAKPSRTPEEQNQFNSLGDAYNSRGKDFSNFSKGFDAELNKQRNEVQGKLVANVRSVIESIAKTKGYTLVLDKSAVYFMTAQLDDITNEVLKALNTPAAGGSNAGASKP